MIAPQNDFNEQIERVVSLVQVPKNFGDRLNIEDEENINRYTEESLLKNTHKLEFSQEMKKQGVEGNCKKQRLSEVNFMSKKTAQSTQNETIIFKSNKYLLRNLQSMSASVLDDNYFKEDTESNEKSEYQRAQADINKIKNYFMKFRFGQFIEFFIIHFLYYFLLGPLLIPFLRLRGRYLAKSLLFYGWNLVAIVQLIFFLLNVSSVYLFFAYDNPNVSIKVELSNELFSAIFRCIVISCKYATFDPLKIEIIRNTHITLHQVVSEFYLTDWSQQKPKIVEEQLNFALRSFDIDPGLFYIQFIVDPLKNTHERIMKSEKISKEAVGVNHLQYSSIPVAKMKDTDKLYFGYTILFDMSRSFQEKYRVIILIFSNLTICIALGRSLVPVIYRQIIYFPNAYSNWSESYIAGCSVLQIFTLYFIITRIMFFALVDLCRKVYMLNQLTFMIAPRKIKRLNNIKLYPTVNIFRSINLKGWSLMRQVAMEYGKPYLLRVQGISIFISLWIILNLVQLVLYQYDIIDSNPVLIIQTIIDVSYFFSIIFLMLIVGAKINELFEIQENLLNSNKTIVSDLLLVGRKYIESQKLSPSFIYTKAIEKVLDVAPEDYVSYTHNLIKQYDNHIQELIYDSEHNPLKLYGVKVTFVLLQSIGVAVGSVIISLISRLLSKK